MRRRRLVIALLLAAVPAALGVVLLRWPVGASLERSYGLDMLFKLRGTRPAPQQLCVVAVDDASFEEYGLDPRKQPWPRGLYGELVETLAREGARVVAFDVVFDTQGDPDENLRFEIGLFDAGNVVLGSALERIDDPRFRQVRRLEPLPQFAESAAAVAFAELPYDADGTIREAWLTPNDRPGLALAAYQLGTGKHDFDDERDSRIIDYYGPPRTIDTISLYQAMDPATYLPPGYFADRIVFVGASQTLAQKIVEARDSFGTPFTGGEVGNTFGVEIHATIAGNLLEGRRISLPHPALELLFLLAIAVVGTFVFVMLRPTYGIPALFALQIAVWLVGYQLFTRGELWFPLVIPTLFMLPAAYGASAVWYYLTTERDRAKIRRAFSFYLSPEMIKRISEDAGSLSLGGEEVVGTALFTDIAGFTSIAERMTAAETASMLNTYFSTITQKLFETGGTLIKYIGDAVFAIWGAPVKVDDHATRACRAAIYMARSADLPTRVGVHTGSMLVGNLGSDQRFDYTAIGDTINLAARLESLNKSTGTHILVSGETLAATDGSFRVRRLGRVGVVGREVPIELYELLGEADGDVEIDAATVERFERALDDYQAYRLDDAEAGFRAVREARGGEDGPSELYLGLIADARAEPPADDWDGVVRFTKK